MPCILVNKSCVCVSRPKEMPTKIQNGQHNFVHKICFSNTLPIETSRSRPIFKLEIALPNRTCGANDNVGQVKHLFPCSKNLSYAFKIASLLKYYLHGDCKPKKTAIYTNNNCSSNESVITLVIFSAHTFFCYLIVGDHFR